MKKYTNILFDMDGTLVNSYEGIANGIKHSLSAFSMPPLAEETLSKFIGPALYDSLEKYCNMKDKDAIHEFIRVFREYYGTVGVYQCSLYDGIPEILETINRRGFNVFLATAKPDRYAEIVLEKFNLERHFKDVYAATLEGERYQKVEVLEYAVAKGGFDVSTCLMVGDRSDDVLAAKAVGMDVLAVRYGFGLEAEFEKADYIVDQAIEILNILA